MPDNLQGAGVARPKTYAELAKQTRQHASYDEWHATLGGTYASSNLTTDPEEVDRG